VALLRTTSDGDSDNDIKKTHLCADWSACQTSTWHPRSANSQVEKRGLLDLSDENIKLKYIFLSSFIKLGNIFN